MAIYGGPPPDHKADAGLQEEGTTDMQQIERRVRLPGNFLWEMLGKHGEAKNGRSADTGDDAPQDTAQDRPSQREREFRRDEDRCDNRQKDI